MTSEEMKTRAQAGDSLAARAKAEKAEAAEKKNTPPKDEDPKPKEAARWYDPPPAGQMSRDERYRQQALANGGK
jgi:hypothetical protein